MLEGAISGGFCLGRAASSGAALDVDPMGCASSLASTGAIPGAQDLRDPCTSDDHRLVLDPVFELGAVPTGARVWLARVLDRVGNAVNHRSPNRNPVPALRSPLHRPGQSSCAAVPGPGLDVHGFRRRLATRTPMQLPSTCNGGSCARSVRALDRGRLPRQRSSATLIVLADLSACDDFWPGAAANRTAGRLSTRWAIHLARPAMHRLVGRRRRPCRCSGRWRRQSQAAARTVELAQGVCSRCASGLPRVRRDASGRAPIRRRRDSLSFAGIGLSVAPRRCWTRVHSRWPRATFVGGRSSVAGRTSSRPGRIRGLAELQT